MTLLITGINVSGDILTSIITGIGVMTGVIDSDIVIVTDVNCIGGVATTDVS